MSLNEDALTDWLVDYLEADSELMNQASGGAGSDLGQPAKPVRPRRQTGR